MVEKFKIFEVPYELLNEYLSKKQLWKNNARCPQCNAVIYGQAYPEVIRSCETGYSYCSEECCKIHVNETYEEGNNE